MKKIDIRYQQLLKDLDLYEGMIDGLIGPKTTKAIKRFQTLNGLSSDGIIGPNTIQAFENQVNIIPDNNKTSSIISNFKPSNRPYTIWPRENTSSLMNFYGNVGENQTTIPIPYKMYLAWDLKKSISRITCHEKVADSLSTILENIKKSYSQEEIERHGFNLFGGTLNVRKIRGGNRWSTHSWGIAIDLDPARNGLRTPWKQAYFSRPECEAFVHAFKDQGWYSLGLEKNFDGMHMQACYR